MTKGTAVCNGNRNKKKPEERVVAIPFRLPMPIGIEIHNCSVPVATTNKAIISLSSTLSSTTTTLKKNHEIQQHQQHHPHRKKKWFHPTEYSMRMLPNQIRLELCIVQPEQQTTKNEKEIADEKQSSLSSLPAKAAAIVPQPPNKNPTTTTTHLPQHILAHWTDTRRSTRVIFSHLDDRISRDALDIYSYEQLMAKFYHQDQDDGDSTNTATITATTTTTTSTSTSSSTIQQQQHHPTSSNSNNNNNNNNIPFVEMNLHPSRLCRIPSLEPVISWLPKNAIIVYFSDQSIRVSPTLYQNLRSINEAFVTMEEKIFEDTAFYTLDPPTAVSSSSSNDCPESTRSKTHVNNGSSPISSITDQPKPSQAIVELEDLQAENEMLQQELDRQEELLRDESSYNISRTELVQEILPLTLYQMQDQNQQLTIELERRVQYAKALQCQLQCERIRLIRQVSHLYSVEIDTTSSTHDDTTTITTTTGAVTIRGWPMANAVSFCNHVIHILLPKYLGIFVRPPPPSQRTAVQRTLAWNATLHCIARNIGMTGSVPVTTTTTSNNNHHILLSIRDIYNHILQYQQDNHSMDHHRSRRVVTTMHHYPEDNNNRREDRSDESR